MTIKHLLQPLHMGKTDIANRIWMAPLTRSRAGQPGDTPTQLNADYYVQRANAGLIVTEAVQVSRQGQGYAWTPGIYSDAQQAGWQAVVEQVHAAGGRIALQLWHVGRISHPLLQPGGADPVAPSAIQALKSKSFVIRPDGAPANETCALPRALGSSELPGIVEQFRAGAVRAAAAGFDLVEIHAANGYLLDQFLNTTTNQRSDAYGGSIENRARLLLEVVDAIAAELGAARIGVRLSPHGVFNDMDDADPETEAMALYLAEAFSQRGIAYLHIAEPDWAGGQPLSDTFRRQLREAYRGALVLCGGYDAERAEATLAAGLADAIAFGRPYLANPDLVERFRRQSELNAPNPATFYGGGAAGYTDYPALAE